MDRERMIEEMEKDLTDNLFKGGVRQLAEDLVMLDYRKLPEGAVVLTKEELAKTTESGYVYDTTSGDKINIIEMAREIERKETATEIIKEFSKIQWGQSELDNIIVRLSEKYGVEVEE